MRHAATPVNPARSRLSASPARAKTCPSSRKLSTASSTHSTRRRQETKLFASHRSRVARIEPPGPAFGRPDDKLSEILDHLSIGPVARVSLALNPGYSSEPSPTLPRLSSRDGVHLRGTRRRWCRLSLSKASWPPLRSAAPLSIRMSHGQIPPNRRSETEPT